MKIETQIYMICIYIYIYRLIHASLFIFVFHIIFSLGFIIISVQKKVLMILPVTLEPSTQSRASSHAPTNIYIYRSIHASLFIHVFHIVFSLGFIIFAVLLNKMF